MAEIGLIASVIQVAGAGLKLSHTLYQYADSVASADRRVKDIAKEVQLTSFVIEELGTLFRHDETSTLLSKNALRTADETVRECSTVFTELDAALKKSKKNTLGRLMLPFRESKIELLRSHIDKLKSTLQLLMQVLTHAHQVASQKLDREAEAAQREQIKTLLQAKKETTKKYEESLRNFSMSEGSTILDDGSDKENENVSSELKTVMSTASIASSITTKTLETCVRHIQSLLEDIENLQQALSKQEDGLDHSEHHQSLIGSYFRARGHLDSVLLGNSKDLHRKDESTVRSASHVHEEDRERMTYKENTEIKRETSSATSERLVRTKEVEIGISKSLTGSTLNSTEIQISNNIAEETATQINASISQADLKKLMEKALEQARREERAKIAAEAQRETHLRLVEAQRKAQESYAQQAAEKEAKLKAMAAAEEARTKAMKEAAEAAMRRKEAEVRARNEAEEAEKRQKEAKENAKAEFERAVKEEAAKLAAKSKPDDAPKAPVKFKDAVGRKFSFPYHLCKSWKMMEEYINQAFLHVDTMSKYVKDRHYDLKNSDGDIILPAFWEDLIEPGADITMYMRPIPQLETSPLQAIPQAALSDSKSVSILTQQMQRTRLSTRPPPPPPPPPPGVEIVQSSFQSRKPKSKKKQKPDPLAAWFAGSAPARKRSHKRNAAGLEMSASPMKPEDAATSNTDKRSSGKEEPEVIKAFKSWGASMDADTMEVLAIGHARNGLGATVQDYKLVISYEDTDFILRPDERPLRILQNLFDEGKYPKLVYERKEVVKQHEHDWEADSWDDYARHEPTSPAYSPIQSEGSPDTKHPLMPISKGIPRPPSLSSPASPPSPLPPSRRAFLAPEPRTWDSGLHRSRSMGHAPAPNVTIYNTTRLGNESSPDVRTEQRSPTASPPVSSRGRIRRFPGEWSIEDELAEIRLEIAKERRSNSRSTHRHYRDDLPRHDSPSHGYDRRELQMAMERSKEAVERREPEKREDREDRIEKMKLAMKQSYAEFDDGTEDNVEQTERRKVDLRQWKAWIEPKDEDEEKPDQEKIKEAAEEKLDPEKREELIKNPKVTIYNSTRIDTESRGRIRRIPSDWSLEDEVDEMRREVAEHRHSRSRSTHYRYRDDSPSYDYDRWQLQVATQRLKEAEEKLEQERREEVIKKKLELTYLKERLEREKAEETEEKLYQERLEALLKEKEKRETIKHLEGKAERVDDDDVKLDQDWREELIEKRLELRFLKKRAKSDEEELRIKLEEEHLKKTWELKHEKEEREKGEQPATQQGKKTKNVAGVPLDSEDQTTTSAPFQFGQGPPKAMSVPSVPTASSGFGESGSHGELALRLPPGKKKRTQQEASHYQHPQPVKPVSDEESALAGPSHEYSQFAQQSGFDKSAMLFEKLEALPSFGVKPDAGFEDDGSFGSSKTPTTPANQSSFSSTMREEKKGKESIEWKEDEIASSSQRAESQYTSSNPLRAAEVEKKGRNKRMFPPPFTSGDHEAYDDWSSWGAPKQKLIKQNAFPTSSTPPIPVPSEPRPEPIEADDPVIDHETSRKILAGYFTDGKLPTLMNIAPSPWDDLSDPEQDTADASPWLTLEEKSAYYRLQEKGVLDTEPPAAASSEEKTKTVFGNSGNLDLGLDFDDSEEALENFDFDNFLHPAGNFELNPSWKDNDSDFFDGFFFGNNSQPRQDSVPPPPPAPPAEAHCNPKAETVLHELHSGHGDEDSALDALEKFDIDPFLEPIHRRQLDGGIGRAANNKSRAHLFPVTQSASPIIRTPQMIMNDRREREARRQKADAEARPTSKPEEEGKVEAPVFTSGPEPPQGNRPTGTTPRSPPSPLTPFLGTPDSAKLPSPMPSPAPPPPVPKIEDSGYLSGFGASALEDYQRQLMLHEQPNKRRLLMARQEQDAGASALEDYQMQLMLLEQQNKKRLLMAREEQDAQAAAGGTPPSANSRQESRAESSSAKSKVSGGMKGLRQRVLARSRSGSSVVETKAKATQSDLNVVRFDPTQRLHIRETARGRAREANDKGQLPGLAMVNEEVEEPEEDIEAVEEVEGVEDADEDWEVDELLREWTTVAVPGRS